MGQVIRTISQPDSRLVYKPKTVPHEVLQKELNYWRSCRILNDMLQKGLITKEEYTKIDMLNRNSFSPMLAKIMP
jgi:hypothetical protein